MRILVYGAGVIGCELAHSLNKQNEVTLLARGAWKQTIDRDGLIIQHYARMRTTVDHVRTVECLRPEDEYDLIFVVMQANQLAAVLPVLAANRSRRIVFVGNNMDAPGTARLACAGAPVEKEIAFGFQGTAGRREEGRVVSVYARPGMTVGGAAGALSNAFRARLLRAFWHSPYRLRWEDDMDAWLKYHAAFILPACYLCYILDGDLTKAGAKLRADIWEAAREGYAALQACGYPIRPKEDEALLQPGARGRAMDAMMRAMLLAMAKTPLGRLCASDHAMHAVGEMQALDAQFEELHRRAAVPMPVWERLRASAGCFGGA